MSKSEVTYSAFVCDWLAFVQRTKSRQTHATYSYLIQEFERFVDHKPWAKVTRDDVHAFLRRPRVKKASGKPAKDSTQRDISIIRSFFTWLAGEGRMSRDDLPIYNLERPKTDEDAVEREPVKEWVWKAVWESGHATMDDRLWLGLGYFCGLRRQEMAMLSPFSVLPRSGRRGSGSLRALRKGGSTQSGISYATICSVLTGPQGVPELATRTDEWMDLLESTACFRHDMPYLLSCATNDVPNTVHTIWRHCRQLQTRVGIPPEDQFSPHNMRHSAATNLALSGVPKEIIRKQLNHSSDEMTSHYINAAMLFDRWAEGGNNDWAV